jgi:hypothetical protein
LSVKSLGHRLEKLSRAACDANSHGVSYAFPDKGRRRSVIFRRRFHLGETLGSHPGEHRTTDDPAHGETLRAVAIPVSAYPDRCAAPSPRLAPPQPVIGV